MLVLSRGLGRALRINDDIIIRILSISKGGHVRIAVKANPSLKVIRQEQYYEDLCANQEKAAMKQPVITHKKSRKTRDTLVTEEDCD